MRFADIRTWFHSRTGWEKAALAIWSAILLFVSVRVFVEPEKRTVYTIFSVSSRFWWTGAEVYEPHRPKDVRDGYRYSPAFTVLFTPFALLPDRIGGVVWRWFSVAVLLGSLGWLARTVFPGRLSRSQLAGMLLLVIPFTVQSVSNGQANLVVIACMLGTLAAVKDERWNLASLFMALAFVCKIYPIALGMVLILLYPRRLAWRIPLAVAASLLFPFLFQHPAYVVDQYQKWLVLLRSEDRISIPLEHMYRDLWLLIHLYDLPISRFAYQLLQVCAGGAIAIVGWRRQGAGWPEQPLLTSTLALVTAWMMLLGPATESSSFVLLAPSFAWSVLEAWQAKIWRARHTLLWGSFPIYFIAVFLGGVNEWKLHETGVHAWGSILYFAYLLAEPRPLAVQEMQSLDSKRVAA